MLEKIESDLHKDAITERKDLYTKDLEITCECTLEEFHQGSIKQLGFMRTILNEASGKTKTEKVTREIAVKPGMKPGMQMRFIREGNQTSDKLVGDLIVTITEVPHATLRRDGDNLIYRHKISLADALSMQVVEFKTLDGETIKFRPD